MYSVSRILILKIHKLCINKSFYLFYLQEVFMRIFLGRAFIINILQININCQSAEETWIILSLLLFCFWTSSIECFFVQKKFYSLRQFNFYFFFFDYYKKYIFNLQ